VTDPRKQHFVDELKRHYGEIIAGARDAEVDLAEAAERLQSEAKGREDAKGAAEFARMAAAHKARRERAKREVDALLRFASGGLARLRPTARVCLGALVDVSIEDEDGSEERTFFVLPVGAGNELRGPGGDGFVSVITPDSPVGRGLVGAVAGDSFEVSVGDVDREWTVLDVC
jgi:transcription elongation GreA/GreB family factor